MLLLGVWSTNASHMFLLGGPDLQVGAAGGPGDCVSVCGLQRRPWSLCPLHTLPLLPVSYHNTLYLYTENRKYKLCSVVLTTLKHYQK